MVELSNKFLSQKFGIPRIENFDRNRLKESSISELLSKL